MDYMDRGKKNHLAYIEAFSGLFQRTCIIELYLMLDID